VIGFSVSAIIATVVKQPCRRNLETAEFDPNRSFGSIHATWLWESLTARWKRGIMSLLHE